MSLSELYLVLLGGGLVLLAGIMAARLASRLRLPSLLLFLALGVAIGEDGPGRQFDDAQLAQNLGLAALGVILVEGGLSTRWADVRPVLAPAGVLAVLGGAVSVGVTAAGAHYLLGIDWQAAPLLGAIMSSTDAAAVFAVLRDLPVPRRLAGLLEAESGFNDAPTVILVTLFATQPLADAGPGGVLANLAYQLAAGGVIGLLIGRLGAAGLRRVAFPATGLYPITAFGLGIVAFAAAGAAQASGFLAAYLAALVLGQLRAPAPGRDPLVRRRAGLAGPDRAVRAARAVDHAERAARRAASRASRGRGPRLARTPGLRGLVPAAVPDSLAPARVRVQKTPIRCDH